jgi:hypothetical protein
MALNLIIKVVFLEYRHSYAKALKMPNFFMILQPITSDYLV